MPKKPKNRHNRPFTPPNHVIVLVNFKDHGGDGLFGVLEGSLRSLDSWITDERNLRTNAKFCWFVILPDNESPVSRKIMGYKILREFQKSPLEWDYEYKAIK